MNITRAQQNWRRNLEHPTTLLSLEVDGVAINGGRSNDDGERRTMKTSLTKKRMLKQLKRLSKD